MWPYTDGPSDSGQKSRSKKRRKDTASESSTPESRVDPSKLEIRALREAALRYLDRQDGAVQQVRRSLRRRVQRYGNDDLKAQAYQDIEVVLNRLVESRILDDERFALALALSCRRKDASLNKVRQKLQMRGLDDTHTKVALESLSEDDELDEEACARIYAKKRRLNQRFNLDDPKERQKALASLARQGFAFDVARSALGF